MVFKDTLTKDILTEIQSEKLSASSECLDILQQMLSRNVEDRPTSEECLSHPWFRDQHAFIQDYLLLNNEAKKLTKKELLQFENEQGLHLHNFEDSHALRKANSHKPYKIAYMSSISDPS